MSLLIWLPLDGNTKNQGLCGGQFTTSGVTFTDGGKIGSKYLSAGTITIPAAISKNLFNNDHMSFAFWLYPIGTSGSGAIMGQTATAAGNNRMYTIFQYSVPTSLHLSWQNNTGSNTFLSNALANFFTANTWTHCCIVYNGSQAIIYKNGVLYTTANGVSNRTSFEYDFPINGSTLRKLNDVRIYDHCLSAAEVHLIYQGLFLHYKLDTIEHGLIDNSGYNNIGYIDNTNLNNLSNDFSVLADTPKYEKSLKFLGKSSRVACDSLPLLLTFTVNFWLKYSSRSGLNYIIDGPGYSFSASDNGSTSTFAVGFSTYDAMNPMMTAVQLTSSQILYDTWYMLTICHDGNTKQFKIYINGVLYESGSTGQYDLISSFGLTHSLTLGSRVFDYNGNITVNNSFLGQLSDFRIYATVLSDNDLLELYHTPVKIDNKQNIFAREFIEATVELSFADANKLVTINHNNTTSEGSGAHTIFSYTTYTGAAHTVASKKSVTTTLYTRGYSNTFPLQPYHRYYFQLSAQTVKGVTGNYSYYPRSSSSSQIRYYCYGKVYYIFLEYGNDGIITRHTLFDGGVSKTSSASISSTQLSVALNPGTKYYDITTTSGIYGKLIRVFYGSLTIPTTATNYAIKSMSLMAPPLIYKTGLFSHEEFIEDDTITNVSIKPSYTTAHNFIEF